MCKQNISYTIYSIEYQSDSDLFIGSYSCQVIKYKLCSPPGLLLYNFYPFVPPGLENSDPRSILRPLELEHSDK